MTGTGADWDGEREDKDRDRDRDRDMYCRYIRVTCNVKYREAKRGDEGRKG